MQKDGWWMVIVIVLKISRKIFNGKDHSTDEGNPTRLDGEIKSAYSTAEPITTSAITGSLNQYVVHDQASNFMVSIKDKSLKRTMDALKLPSSVGSDILSSIDIILVRKKQRRTDS